MSSIGRAALLVLCHGLGLLSLFLFASGFFQPKPLLSELLENEPPHVDYRNLSGTAPFDKIVFMVVDALRR